MAVLDMLAVATAKYLLIAAALCSSILWRLRLVTLCTVQHLYTHNQFNSLGNQSRKYAGRGPTL